MSKALVLFGSPHKDGTTAALLEHFLEYAAFDEIVHIDAYSLNISPCIDCGKCAESFGCVYDDLSDIRNAIETSDAIIVASPIYNRSLPSPLKAIFDRFQMYFNARFKLMMKPVVEKEKIGVLLLAAGSGIQGESDARIVQEAVRRCFSVTNTRICTSMVICDTDKGVSDAEIAQAARQAALSVLRQMTEY